MLTCQTFGSIVTRKMVTILKGDVSDSYLFFCARTNTIQLTTTHGSSQTKPLLCPRSWTRTLSLSKVSFGPSIDFWSAD